MQIPIFKTTVSKKTLKYGPAATSGAAASGGAPSVFGIPGFSGTDELLDQSQELVSIAIWFVVWTLLLYLKKCHMFLHFLLFIYKWGETTWAGHSAPRFCRSDGGAKASLLPHHPSYHVMKAGPPVDYFSTASFLLLYLLSLLLQISVLSVRRRVVAFLCVKAKVLYSCVPRPLIRQVRASIFTSRLLQTHNCSSKVNAHCHYLWFICYIVFWWFILRPSLLLSVQPCFQMSAKSQQPKSQNSSFNLLDHYNQKEMLRSQLFHTAIICNGVSRVSL